MTYTGRDPEGVVTEMKGRYADASATLADLTIKEYASGKLPIPVLTNPSVHNSVRSQIVLRVGAKGAFVPSNDEIIAWNASGRPLSALWRQRDPFIHAAADRVCDYLRHRAQTR